MTVFQDRFGRKTVCLMATFIISLSIIINEVLQLKIFGLDINSKYLVYTITQFLLGFFVSTNYYASFILLLEITSSKHTTIVSNFYDYIYVFGELLVLVVSYYARNCHLINYFIGSYSLLIFLLVAIFIPESPRFLVTKKKYKEAYSVLKQIAKINGTQSNITSYQDFLDLFSDIKNHQIKALDNNSNTEAFDLIMKKSSLEADKKDPNNKPKNYLFSANRSNSVYNYLFKEKNNFLVTFLLSYIWIAISIIYFGVSLGRF
jgi:MFS family permease